MAIDRLEQRVVFFAAVACCWLVFPFWLPAQSDSELSRLAQGLRSRRLFDLAETLCRDGLASSELNPAEQATLVLELLRSQTARAAVSSGLARDKAWENANQTATEFIAQNSNHPRILLVEVQQALTHLTHGRLLRQELEAELAPETARDMALVELRKANSIFEELQRKIKKLIPVHRVRTVGKDELSAEQLMTLNNNLRLQSAIAGINRAQLYPVDDKLNRIDALNVGLERLTEVRRETNPDEPIWWRTELQRAKCNRLLGRHIQASKIIAELPLEDSNLQTKQAVAAEQIRLVIAEGNLKLASKLLAIADQIKDRSSELDLAIVELMMKLASSTEQNDWTTKASQLLAVIEKRHGAYWGRRAEMLVIGKNLVPENGSATGTANVGSAADLDLLIRMGDQAVRKNRLEAALKAYANAASKADKQKNWPIVFSANVRQSQVLEKLKRHRDAYLQLTGVATKLSNFEHAPAAHLRGCWNLSQTMNSSGESNDEIKQEFLVSLDTHIQRWPESKTADQARLWAGRQLQSNQKWNLAIEKYLGIQTDSPFFPDAIKNSYVCMEAVLKLDSTLLGPAREYIDKLRSLANDPNASTEIRAHAILARAKIGTRYGIGDIEKLANELIEVLKTADDETRMLLSSQLVVALSAQVAAPDSVPSLPEVLNTIGSDEPALHQAVKGINAVIAREQKSNSDELFNSKLWIANAALKLDLTEIKRTEWMGQWADALQRLGRDSEAVDALTELAKKKPNSAEVQVQLSRALTRMPGESATERALTQWRRLATRLKPKTENWFEAKYNIALLLKKTGDANAALKLLEYLKAVPPGWSNSKWKSDFDRLFINCQNE